MSQHTNRRSFRVALLVLVVTVGWAGASSHALGADLSGHWEGHWKSCNTGHNGVLRADFCRLNPAQYRVNFSGRFFKIMPFRYSVVLNVVEETEDTVSLSGSSYLGRLMGTFRYSATVTGNQFYARYSSKKDCGYFSMTRCCR